MMGIGDANSEPPAGALSTDVKADKHPIAVMTAMLASKQDKIAEISTDYIGAEMMVRLVSAAMTRNPSIAACAPISVLNSVLLAAQCGLDPSGGTKGEAYLVPFKGECTFMPGYRGLIKIALRSPEVKSVHAQVVYEQDQFEAHLGTEPRIVHVPALGQRSPDDIKAAYAYAKLADGSMMAEVMTLDELQRVANVSRSKGGPRSQWAGEMHRKAPIRRLCKFLPLPDKVQEQLLAATEHDNTVQDARIEQPSTATALLDKLKSKKENRA